jgi:Uma2 family endonuclease
MSSVLPNPNVIYSFADLLELEELTGLKYELVDGYIVAMTGGSKAHNLIALGLFTAIDNQKDPRCRLYVADVKLRFATDRDNTDKESSTYPDVMLACGKEISDLYEENPLLLAEVVSDGTARKDNVIKREKYLKLPSLYVYLILSQTDMMMTVYQRQNNEGTHAVFLEKDADVELQFGNKHNPLKLNLGQTYKYVENRI